MQEHSIAQFRCCLRRRPRETNPLFLAITNNDLNQFKSLIESGKSINTKNNRGSTPLTCIIDEKRIDFFDYLLQLEDLDVDGRVSFGRTPLLYTAVKAVDAHFALELIKKGANIHSQDDNGFSYLHLAARNIDSHSLAVGQELIEKGVDINAQACYGMTPLYIACEEGNFNWICMLLFYGSDATIPSAKGVLPLTVVSSFIPVEEQIQLQALLFDYTFDEFTTSVQLSTLAQAMTLDSELFLKILDATSDVTYDIFDLNSLYSILIYLKPKYLRLFIGKFSHIVLEMIENFSPLTMLIGLGFDLDLPNLKEILCIFLESEFASIFIQTSDSTFPTIARLVQMFNKREMFVEEEEVTKIVCLMLSYGLNVVSDDLDTVYSYYGYSELFRILLHMDISINNTKQGQYSMSVLYYDIQNKININNIIDKVLPSHELLCYYNNSKLKEFCMRSPVNDKIKMKAESLPQIPFLVELSRNVVREFIVKRYNVTNSLQFYGVIRSLPIGEMTKSIIALEKQLY